MSIPADFIEATDERGQALLIHRGEIAVIRDLDPAIGLGRTVIVLKSGEVVVLQTKFADVCERLTKGT